MAVKFKDADKRRLADNIERYRSAAGGYTNGAEGQHVVEAWQYYYGELPAPYCNGGSKYVSRDVWEAVNGTLQELLTTFTASHDVVQFYPRGKFDTLAAKAATQYVNDTILRKNKGYRVLHDAFKEALVARNGYVKRYWKEDYRVEEEEFTGLTQNDLAVLIQDRTVTLEEDDLTKNEDGTYNGSLARSIDISHVEVVFCPYEEILLDPDARNIEDSNYFGHRRDYTVQDVIDMGFDEDEVKKGTYEATVAIDTDVVRNARNLDEDMYMTGTTITGDALNERVWLHEEYIKSSIGAKKGEVKLYQVFSLGKVILEVNEVDEIPFSTFTPFPVPNQMNGESVFDIMKDIQDVKTALTRGYIDNIMNANYGRYMAVKNQYDRKSLLDNRPGGVVEQNAPGMIDRFPYHALPVGTDQLLETFEQTKERRTGVTRTSMGLNADVFKNDNAYATVNMMMSAAQNRLRMVARNISETGLRDLFLSIYRIARQNEKKPIVVNVQGQEVTMIPAQWPERSHVQTSVAVGSNERDERAQKLTMLLTTLSSNPMLAGQSFQPANANFLAKELCSSLGFDDVGNFVTSIENIPQPQPNPAEQLALAKLQADVQLTQMDSQVRQAQAQETMVKAQLSAAKIQLSKVDVQRQMAELQFKQEQAADDMRRSQEDSASKNQDMAIKAAQADAELDVKMEELKLRARELDLKEKEIMLEAQLEAIQRRPVGLAD